MPSRTCPRRGGRRSAAAAVALAVVALAGTVTVTGCSPLGGGEERSSGKGGSSTAARDRTGPTGTSRPGGGDGDGAAGPPEPRTAAQFVARARQFMKAGHGWTFALRGSESAVMRGQTPSSATYTATVHRTTDPLALRQTGTITTSKGERKPEVVYVVGGTAYVKSGDHAWTKGPLTDARIAQDVEDPLAELDAFAAYAKSAEVSRTGTGGQDVRLKVGASGWALSAARGRPALKIAVREVAPTLAQLRKAGVTATDDRITLRSFTETWDLDGAHGYRVTSHRYAFTFLVPFQGGDITVSQEVRADNRGPFTGSVALPPDAR